MNNLNIEAIQQIDRIIQSPKINIQKTGQNSAGGFTNDAPYVTVFEGDFSEMVEEASRALETVTTELTFRVHEGTGRPIIQLVELVSDEVIREIPPEKMLDMVAGIWEWAGLIIDRRG